jgi:NADP-dependent 3-hydroxy acid dehydrogenase YdfG
MNKLTFITGATSGIGQATAEKFAEMGCDLIITGRRKDRLNALKKALESQHHIKVAALHFDVRNENEVSEAVRDLKPPWTEIEILINNAGLAAGLDHIQNGKLDDWERMIDTNIKGLLYMTRAMAPLFIKNGRGHIINVGSTAGKEVYEKGNVYCATKHAVDALNKGMRIDLLQHGIKVTAVNPGLVETEFSLVRFHGDAEKARIPYEGMQPLRGEDVAEVIWYVSSLPDHVNINDIVVTATAQANSFYIKRG